MIKGIYSSASGMQPHSVKLEVIANNLANIDTTGFKKDNVFLQVLDQQRALQRTSAGFGDLAALDAREYTDYSQGSFRTTSNPFDVALLGDGFFAVDTPQGVRYTRNGNFSLAQDGTIQTSDGFPVLASTGSQLRIDNWNRIASGDISISPHGEVTVDKVTIGQLKIVDFPKPYALEKEGNSLFAPKEKVVPLEADQNTVIKQGMLEESNIDAIEEMVNMIELNRSYETDQHMTTIQDGTLDKAMEIGRV